jgi:hypothetical protein
MSGKVVHFEIPAEDVDRARKFYKWAFGWRMNPLPELKYTMVETVELGPDRMPKEPGAINGGMMKREGPVNGPVITIAVDDIDKALKTVEKLGGKVVQKKVTVGDMGFSAYFKDPEGNIMGLWQAVMRPH